MELGAFILFAKRLPDTVAFYRALGLPLEEEHHDDQDDGPAHYACDLGAVHFSVFEGVEGQTPTFRAVGGVMPGLAVASLERAFEAVKEFGAPIIQPPTEYPWGPRMLVEDPDGRTIELFERRG